MRTLILSLTLAATLASAALPEEVALAEGQRSEITLIGLTAPAVHDSLRESRLVGTFSQLPIELQATPVESLQISEWRPRPLRLEELTPRLPDRSRPYILQPNNSVQLIRFSL